MRDILAGLPISTATDLVRAFATYFQLANGAEQVHRVRALRATPTSEGHLARAVDEIARTLGPDELARRDLVADGAPGVHGAPHGGQPAIGADQAPPAQRDPRRAHRSRVDGAPSAGPRLAELIDLIWQTDELRQFRPTPLDEARNALFYVRGILGDTVPELMSDLADELAEHGVALSPTASPLTLGTWIGGDRDGNPNVTADVTREVLRLQHELAIRLAIRAVDELIMDAVVLHVDRGGVGRAAPRRWTRTWPTCTGSTRGSRN